MFDTLIYDSFYINYGINNIPKAYLGDMTFNNSVRIPILFTKGSWSDSAEIAVDTSTGSSYSDYTFQLNLENKSMTHISPISTFQNLRFAVHLDSTSIPSNHHYFVTNFTKPGLYPIIVTANLSNNQLVTANTSINVSHVYTNITQLANITFDLMQEVNESFIVQLFKHGYDMTSCILSCSNRGLCVFSNDAFSCLCNLFYYDGAACEVDQRHCTNNPCMHNGICNELYSAGFECKCPPLYYGKNCENKVDLCANVTCSYHGNCMVDNTNNSVWCDCYNLYSGDACEAKNPELETIETTTTVSTTLAIVSLVSLFVCAIISDISDHYMKLRRKKIKNSMTNKKQQKGKKWSKNKKGKKIKAVRKKGIRLVRVQPRR